MSISETFCSASSTSQAQFARAASAARGLLAGASSGIDEDARALQQIGTKLRIARNATIFWQGDTADYAYKVVSGVVRLCKHLADGRRHVAQFSIPGDFFSVMEFENHAFTAEAVTDVVLMRYPQFALSALSEDRPTLGRRFASVLSQRLCEMQNHLTVLGRQTAKERIASFLLYLSERMGVDEDALVDVPMSRHDIADYLGLTDETVCRVLAELKRARLIEAPNVRHFILLDLEALQSLADGEGPLAAAA